MWLWSDVHNSSAVVVPVQSPWPEDATVAELLKRVGVADPHWAAGVLGFTRVVDFIHAPYWQRIRALRRLPWKDRMKAADAAHRVSAGLLPYWDIDGQLAERRVLRTLAALSIAGGSFVNRTTGLCSDVESATSVLELAHKRAQEWRCEVLPTVLYIKTLLASVYMGSNRMAQADIHSREVVAALKKMHRRDPKHPDIALTEFQRANAAFQNGDKTHVSLYRSSSEVLAKCLGMCHHYVTRGLYYAALFEPASDDEKAENLEDLCVRWWYELGEAHVAFGLLRATALVHRAFNMRWLARNTGYALKRMSATVELLELEQGKDDPVSALGRSRRAVLVSIIAQSQRQDPEFTWQQVSEWLSEAIEDCKRASEMHSNAGVENKATHWLHFACDRLERIYWKLHSEATDPVIRCILSDDQDAEVHQVSLSPCLPLFVKGVLWDKLASPDAQSRSPGPRSPSSHASPRLTDLPDLDVSDHSNTDTRGQA
eukprot:TRINITY_DN13382_c0_g2_i3.p1 TRINITY_DN13382_c0_g2~~TRINITY_DN13382_c0_g2_i3.p1  ORF type:complete len:511 (+),score=97.41 TRINITY_DN13382_c0_g2_i3:79-1533(+)